MKPTRNNPKKVKKTEQPEKDIKNADIRKFLTSKDSIKEGEH